MNQIKTLLYLSPGRLRSAKLEDASGIITITFPHSSPGGSGSQKKAIFTNSQEKEFNNHKTS